MNYDAPTSAEVEGFLRVMKHYYRLAFIDGRTKAADHEAFYGFAATAVRDLHGSRIIPGDPPRIEHCIYFRLFNGIVVNAFTAERLGQAESARELYDVSIN